MPYSYREWAVEEKCTTTQLLGYFTYLENYNQDKATAKIGEGIFNGTWNKEQGKVSVLEGLLIKETFQIGYHKWIQLRRILMDSVELPPSYLLSMKAKMMSPDFAEFQHGIRANLESCIRITLQEHLLSVKKDFGSNITFKLNYGIDGAGKHQDYDQKSKSHFSTSNVMMGCFTLLEIQSDGKEIWNVKNIGHNSPKSTRVFMLFPGKESQDLLRQCMPGIENELKQIKNTGIAFELNGTNVEARMPESPNPMVDGKMITTLLGLHGGYCTMCTFSMAECHDQDIISQGFIINRSLSDIIQRFNELADDEGHIKSQKGDYPVRQGITSEPIAKESDLTRIIPALHSKIQGLRWILNLLRKIKGIKRWHHASKPARYNKDEKETDINAWKVIIEKVRQEFGINISDPARMLEGNMFRKLSSDEARRILSDMIEDETDKEHFIEVHLNVCVAIRVINAQRKKISVDEFKLFCEETNLKIIQYFPWAVISPSVHRLLAHSWEVIEGNDGFPLGSESEEGLESNNKFVRALRREGARKTSTEDNFKDTFQHLWLKSSPLLFAIEKEKAKRRKERKMKASVNGEIDTLVASFFEEEDISGPKEKL